MRVGRMDRPESHDAQWIAEKVLAIMTWVLLDCGTKLSKFHARPHDVSIICITLVVYIIAMFPFRSTITRIWQDDQRIHAKAVSQK